MSQAYPLHWPAGYPRTLSRARARFGDLAFGTARDRVIDELYRMRAAKIILSTNVPIKNDGLPYANRGRVADPGVAVYFEWKKHSRVISCDKWDRIEDNLHAIELTVAAMRGLERWGASDILDRVFQGLAQLPAPAQDDWATVLGVHHEWSLEFIEAEYRKRMRAEHPDAGGSHENAQRLNWAITEARQAKASQ